MKKEDIIKLLIDKLPSVIDLSKFQYIEYADIGYFGRVSSEDFVSYEDLCNQLDFQDGKLMNDNGWLAFWYKGSVLFISQHPVRYNISWDVINEHNLVFGERSVDIGNSNYSVMLPTGCNKVSNDTGTMWNDLIYRVHKDYGTWDELSNVDLNVNSSECEVGTSSWSQESYDGVHRTYRGHHWLESVHASTSSYTSAHYGARLVLKLNSKYLKTNNTENNIIEVTDKYCNKCGNVGSYYDDYDKLVRCDCGNLKLSNKVDTNYILNNIENKKSKYDKYMMDTAVIWKTLSVCKRNQVGCVIGTESGRILVNGYNGTVSGTDNDCEKVCDVCHGKDVECSRCNNGRKVTSDFVVHAEQNAIAFAAKEGIKLNGTILYTTTSPCAVCAKLIASSGISRVVYLETYRDTSGIDFLNKCGVSCTKL